VVALVLQFPSVVPALGYLGRSGMKTFSQRIIAGLDTVNRTLRRGKHRLLLWPDVEADGSVETTTPSKMEVQDEMGRLEKVPELCFVFISVLLTPVFFSLSRNTNAETFRNQIGWISSHSGKWKRSML
jgi:hypothetical protein